LIQRIEQILADHGRPSFDLEISGVPYVVELIRRYLLRDLRVFSIAAFAVFGVVISLLYRSVPPVAGTLLSCLGACLVTLTVLNLLAVPIGMLTANIATIVFVLTLSHTIFLTANWKRVRPGLAPEEALSRALHMTFTSSFWCMVAALMGFGSLLLASAKPLRELGTSGVTGTAVAILVAYGFYPFFLRSAPPLPASGKATAQVALPGVAGPAIVAVLCVVAALGLLRTNTDPNLLTYFAKGSELREGLELIDRSGGIIAGQAALVHLDGWTVEEMAIDAGIAMVSEACEPDSFPSKPIETDCSAPTSVGQIVFRTGC
jgi:predicted RND superfamily exporter protein